MRKPIAVLSAALALAGIGAAAALAAPRAGATYRGTGHDYFNNGPKWRILKHSAQPLSFKVSHDRTRVLNLVGKYSYYCGAGTSTLTASSLKIAHGHFGGTGKRATKYGVNYFAVSGGFSASGTTASVTYLDDFVYRGKKVSDPYSFAYHAPKLACESRVTATVRAG